MGIGPDHADPRILLRAPTDPGAVEVSVIFSTTGKLLSRLIRWFTRSRVSHSVVCLSVAGVALVLEATMGGVKATTRKKWERSNKIVREFKVIPRISIAHACGHLGERYDYVGLLGYLPVLVARWLGRKIKNPLAAPGALVCAEFVLHLDHGGLIPEWKGLDPESATPEDVLRACEQGKSFAPVQTG